MKNLTMYRCSAVGPNAWPAMWKHMAFCDLAVMEIFVLLLQNIDEESNFAPRVL
jgi:hypothetical protein